MVWLPQQLWRTRRLPALPPAVAADAALRLFCTPALSQWRHPKHHILTERARYYLRNADWQRLTGPLGALQTYHFAPDTEPHRGTVLLIHGWTGEASFMTAIAEPIRRVGYRVVLFDLPGHGLSAGRATNLMDCARATAWLADQIGADAIVAHSFGSMVGLVAMEGAPPMPHGLPAIKGIALISSPNELTEVTRKFARHWSLDDCGRRAFEQRLERIGRRPIGCFTVSRLLNACGRPALLVHARDDDEVPFANSEQITADCAGAELLAFDGLGHRNILFASQVARRVVTFLRGL